MSGNNGSDTKRRSACACWDFRITVTDDVQPETLKSFLKPLAKKWVFQTEQGMETGYIHYQGRMSTIKKTTKFPLLTLFKESGINPGYLEPTVTSEMTKFILKNEASYQMKSQTRIDGPWRDNDPSEVVYIPRQYKGLMEKLYPFQETILNMSKLHDHRCVNLVYSPSGNQGRSTISQLARFHKGALKLPASLGNSKDMMQFMHGLCAEKTRDPGMVFIDLPRAMKQEKLFQMYTVIEEIKEGFLYDPRYKAQTWDIESPIVWVLSNTLPDMSYLSLDRWKIWIVDEKRELVPYVPPVEVNMFVEPITPEPEPVKISSVIKTRGRPKKVVTC